MLHLIPAPLHRVALRIAHTLRKAWWRVRAPRVEGCRVLAFEPAGRLLLIRHSYLPDKWMPPGGGLGRREEPLSAARRELLEETGCRIEDARVVDRVIENLHGAGNVVHIVAGRTKDEPRPDMREVIEARFFHVDALPANLAGTLAEDLPRWMAAGPMVGRDDDPI